MIILSEPTELIWKLTSQIIYKKNIFFFLLRLTTVLIES